MDETYVIVVTIAKELRVYGLWAAEADAEDYNNGVFAGAGKIVPMTNTKY